MTQLDDTLLKAKLPFDWKPMWKGTYGKDGDSPFRLYWDFPFIFTFSKGKKVQVNSYQDFTEMIQEICYYYHNHGKKHPFTF